MSLEPVLPRSLWMLVLFDRTSDFELEGFNLVRDSRIALFGSSLFVARLCEFSRLFSLVQVLKLAHTSG